MSGEIVPGKLVRMPSNSGGARLAITVETPCAQIAALRHKVRVSKALHHTTQARAVRSGPQPVVVGFAENP
jgi:hypothetical protein